MKQAVYNLKKKKLSDVELSDAVFGAPLNRAFLHQTLLTYRANKRQGTVETKTRSDISGSTRKIYRQKGTGQARHGDIKAPIFVGGGSVFGPHQRNWQTKIPPKVKKKALIEALSLKAKQGELILLDQFQMETPKTKVAASILKDLGVQSALIVMEKATEATLQSVRNIPYCKVCRVTDLNAYDVIYYKNLLLTKDSVEKVEQWLQS